MDYTVCYNFSYISNFWLLVFTIDFLTNIHHREAGQEKKCSRYNKYEEMYKVARNQPKFSLSLRKSDSPKADSETKI